MLKQDFRGHHILAEGELIADGPILTRQLRQVEFVVRRDRRDDHQTPPGAHGDRAQMGNRLWTIPRNRALAQVVEALLRGIGVDLLGPGHFRAGPRSSHRPRLSAEPPCGPPRRIAASGGDGQRRCDLRAGPRNHQSRAEQPDDPLQDRPLGRGRARASASLKGSRRYCGYPRRFATPRIGPSSPSVAHAS